MEKTIHECEEKESVPRPSSYPEFADIFSFLQHFGKELGVPDVTLNTLEEFFINGECSAPPSHAVVAPTRPALGA